MIEITNRDLDVERNQDFKTFCLQDGLIAIIKKMLKLK